MQYVWGLILAIFGPGRWWWVSLVLTYILGIGFFGDYQVARAWVFRAFGLTLPETFPAWWILVPFLLWIIVRLAHREAMVRLRAGRIIFDDPYVDPFVTLWNKTTGQRLGENDIAKIRVRNSPFDGARGMTVTDAYASMEFYDRVSQRLVLQFDYPRWQENPMPAYHNNPWDHIPNEWNRRDLRPTGEGSTLNFLVKTRPQDRAYGFRTASQLKPQWHDTDLELLPGNYLAKLVVAGVGLRKAAEQWLSVKVGGVDEPLRIEKTAKPETRWF